MWFNNKNDSPKLLYPKGNNKSRLLLSLASALHFMDDKYAYQYIHQIKEDSTNVLNII